ncbi:5-(carboxyamino)imidazole ribonucleotide synthase [Candidatus Njordibacter sp. Uisw_056]|uniref:5-(carboxyamino)imidazole ribonucleotide synthase n=1 Tax=Candidatus Njordibacter sp. Uisw_056 TaxID=3230973 RepID=UPI003D548F64
MKPAIKRVWVLGAGQLGAMLKHAAQPLGVDLRPVDIELDAILALEDDDVITAEREQWPSTVATDQLAAHANFVNQDVFSLVADRVTQKQLLDRLKLATAPWALVEEQHTAASLHEQYGDRVLLKQRTGGFDGRGQHWLVAQQGSAIPQGWHDKVIAEQAIAFDEEVSIVGVRNRAGDCHYYPLGLNRHQDGILTVTLAPLERLTNLQSSAETMLGKVMDELNYVGVMAMELFRLGERLLINELAPRVHNSGHWTQSGASISQFEYHVRATADLPLVPALIKHNSVMINLIGIDYNLAWLALPGAEVFWYGKEVRPVRKVGHINFSMADKTQLIHSLRQLQATLTDWYQPALDWAIDELES